jgi:signal transduction histidine kinase
MKKRSIEPGLLQVFRIFILIRFVIIFVSLRIQRLVQVQRGRMYLVFLLLEVTLLLLYLTWPWPRKRLGKAYLPLALIYATVIPIIEQAALMLSRSAEIIAGDPATGGIWGLVILLLVPLILVSWQYSLISVALYIGGTAIFEWAFTIPIGYRLGLDNSSLFGVVIVRSILFLLIGSILTRLMRDQRKQREALAQANIELAQHATTIEQLAISQERNRLAREMHDTLAHTLSGLAVQLEAMNSVRETDPGSLSKMLESALNTTRTGLAEARLAIRALRATPLDDLGFIVAIKEMAQSAADRANLSLELQLAERIEILSPEAEQSLYRIAEQAINNVTQHANAKRLLVRMGTENGHLTLTIQDDGQGFISDRIDSESHFGLQGMRERAEILGGRMNITSQPGKGSTIQVVLEE